MKTTITSAALAAALLLPAVAGAHPSVYTTTARTVPEGVTRPTEQQLVDQTRYVVNNHGLPAVYRETNGDTTGGVINYAVLPGAYRGQLTSEQLLDPKYGAGVQPHAQCDVATLETPATVLAWQESENSAKVEPFYDYVPWQTAAADLDDTPERWLAVIRDRTGVDLRTAGDPAAACASIGGTYVAADAVQTAGPAFASGHVGHATAPLKAEVETLLARVAAIQAELDAARAAAAAAPAPGTPTAALKVLSSRTPAAAAARAGVPATVAGPAGAPVTVAVEVPFKRARQLGLTSTTLGSGSGTTGADGRLQLSVKLSSTAAKAVRRAKKSVKSTVRATSGDRFATTVMTIAK